MVIPLSEIILYKYFVFINCFFDMFLLSEEDTISERPHKGCPHLTLDYPKKRQGAVKKVP